MARSFEARARQRILSARRIRALDLAYELIVGTVGGFLRHDGHIYAAAVAFYSTVSLFPFLMLVVSVAGFVVGGEEGGTPEASALFVDLLGFLRSAVPYLEGDLEPTLRHLMERRAQFGLAGAIALLLSSSLVFRSLEFALARVLSLPEADTTHPNRPRNLVTSKLVFGAFAMSIVITLLGIRYLLGFLRGVIRGAQIPLPGTLEQILLGDSSAVRSLLWSAVVVIAFTAVLTFFTRKGVRPRVLLSLAGGGLYLLLWSAAGWAFDLYVGRFAALPATYGHWAALIVIQLWIFYSAVVFIVACEFVESLRRSLGGGRTEREG